MSDGPRVLIFGIVVSRVGTRRAKRGSVMPAPAAGSLAFSYDDK